jgi:uncharacterized small protein (DUF1192 family)
MTQLLFTVLLIAICPLMMFFVMRGMHSGGRPDDTQMQKPALPMLGSSTQDARIAYLESEVARLSRAGRAEGTPHSIVADLDHREVDAVSTASTR